MASASRAPVRNLDGEILGAELGGKLPGARGAAALPSHRLNSVPKYWNSAIAVQYGVRAIPCPVLVDGDTGKIIATDTRALGNNLTKALDLALAAKGSKR